MKLSFLWFWPRRVLEHLREKWNTDPATAKESHAWDKFMTAQETALSLGNEIEPPWVVFRGSEPWNFKQGNNEVWMKWIWVPFWERLTKEERRSYALKWHASDYWEELLLGDWLLIGDPEEEKKKQEWLLLLKAQEEALRLGKAVEPPWVIYPASEPKHYNWGETKEWLNRVWMPFWKSLTPEERRAYVKERDTPLAWQDLLLGAWFEIEAEEKKR